MVPCMTALPRSTVPTTSAVTRNCPCHQTTLPSPAHTSPHPTVTTHYPRQRHHHQSPFRHHHQTAQTVPLRHHIPNIHTTPSRHTHHTGRTAPSRHSPLATTHLTLSSPLPVTTQIPGNHSDWAGGGGVGYPGMLASAERGQCPLGRKISRVGSDQRPTAAISRFP